MKHIGNDVIAGYANSWNAKVLRVLDESMRRSHHFKGALYVSPSDQGKRLAKWLQYNAERIEKGDNQLRVRSLRIWRRMVVTSYLTHQVHECNQKEHLFSLLSQKPMVAPH